MPKKTSSNYSKLAGAVIIIAAIEIVVFVLIAQHLYPGYSLANNYISDLGVGSTADIFNVAIRVFGILLIIASCLLYRTGRHLKSAIAFAVIGIGGVGVGLFPETTGLPHIIFAFITFGSVMVTALGFSRVYKGYLSYYSLIAGLIAFAVLSLFIISMAVGTSVTFGLGKGGVEEILFYDELTWAVVTGVSFVKGII